MNPLRLRYVPPAAMPPLAQADLLRPGVFGAWTELPGTVRRFTRDAPEFVDDPDGTGLLPGFGADAYASPPVTVSAADGVTLFGYRAMTAGDMMWTDEPGGDPAQDAAMLARLTGADPFISEDTGLQPGPAPGELLLNLDGRARRHAPGVTLCLCSHEPSNYGSFLFRVLPKLATAEALGLDCLPVAVWASTAFTGLLALCGVDPSRVVAHDPRALTTFDRVVSPSLRNPQGYLDGESHAFMQRLAQRVVGQGGAPSGVGRLLYVSRMGQARRGASTRVLENEAELADALSALGFTIFEPEAHPPAAQVAAFANADMVVGPAGAAMFNTVFCRPGTKVMDIESETHWVFAHAGLFASCKLRYGLFLGRADPGDTRREHRRWTVNVPALASRVEAWKRSMAPGSMATLMPAPAPASAPPQPSPFQKEAGREFDHLATDQSWTDAKAAALDAMRALRPTRLAAVVAAAKDEGPYVLEWVAHHRAVGFEHLFIYTNANRDGSDALYDALAQAGVITVIRNDAGPDASPQVRAYEHAMLHLPELWDFEWAAFLDLDELLVPAARHNHFVPDMLRALDAAHPGQPPAALRLNWMWHGSGGAVEREDGLVQDRFVHAAPHELVKSVARLRAIRSMRRIHLPDKPDGAPDGPGGWFTVDGAFQPVRPPEPYVNVPRYDAGEVRHYFNKSFAEFCIKSRRGEGSSPGGSRGKPVDKFFAWDVPVADLTRHPMPDSLRARTVAELAALQALPGVAEAAQEVARRFGQLERDTIGPSVHEEHARALQALNAPGETVIAVSMAVDGVPPPAVVSVPDLRGDHYHDVLRRLHAVLRPQTYLEVGVAAGATMALASCASIGVDPGFAIGGNLGALLDRPSMSFYRMTSDEFFARYNPQALLGAPVEMAFLDGLHHCEALLRDFIHTERCCRPSSLVVLHDCLPVEVAIATRTPGQLPALAVHHRGWWAGDVWRTALLLKRRRPDLHMLVLDSSPTGLVLLSNLQPGNDSLAHDYEACVAEMLSWDLAGIGLDRLFAELDVQPTSSLATESQIMAQFRS